jgi:hypothetical protein
MFMKRRALMEPASRRVARMIPRVARTVVTEGAGTAFRGCGRSRQAPAATTVASRT